MPVYDAMRVAGMRFSQLCGLVLMCVLAFSGPSLAPAAESETSDVQPAAALIDPAISSKELAYLPVPLTKDEL
jgi:hypothetical protein